MHKPAGSLFYGLTMFAAVFRGLSAKCKFQSDSRDALFSCDQVNFPDDVNVTSIPSNTTVIIFGDLMETSSLAAGSPPIPALPLLKRLMLYTFDIDGAGANRVNAFLSNVKATIEEYNLKSGRLEVLTVELLAGFISLREFTVWNTGLKSLDLNAFSQLQEPDALPTLTSFEATVNPLAEIDLAVFKPVAGSLRTLNFDQNHIKHVTSSTNFTLPHTTSINMARNRLQTVSAEALWVIPAIRVIEAEYNLFCQEDADCRCCSLAPLLKFLRDHTEVTMITSCGQDQRRRYQDCTSRGPSASCEGSCLKRFHQAGGLVNQTDLDKYHLAADNRKLKPTGNTNCKNRSNSENQTHYLKPSRRAFCDPHFVFVI